jgi:hypothetical protein
MLACVFSCATIVSVDDGRHGPVRDLARLVEDRLAVVGELRVDERDAVRHDEHGGVSTLPRDDIEVVPDLVDASGRELRHPGDRRCRRACDHDGGKNRCPFHHAPPGKNTRSTNQ